MILGVDASNLRAGGGITHLIELLDASEPETHGFEKVFVWAGASTLERLSDYPWLSKVHAPLLDRRLPFRLYWQRFVLASLARSSGCDLLLVPGGSYSGSFRPFVTMSRNMLPFDTRESRKYGFSIISLKLLILRISQSRSLREADGVIFLSNFARRTIGPMLSLMETKTVTIPHGINERFFSSPRVQFDLAQYSFDKPLRLLYISHIEPYKNQWTVVEAVARLRRESFPVVIDIVGAPGNAMPRFKRALQKYDPGREFVTYQGAQPFERLPEIYQSADVFVYASTCENLPNTLLEAMASGLPIASSRKLPMPEVLASGGVYFDAEKTEDLVKTLATFLHDKQRRSNKAKIAFERAHSFSWQRCARETYCFLHQVLDRA